MSQYIPPNKLHPATPFEFDYRSGWVFVRNAEGEFVRVSNEQISKSALHEWLKTRFADYSPSISVSPNEIETLGKEFSANGYFDTLDSLSNLIQSYGYGVECVSERLSSDGTIHFSEAVSESRGAVLTVYTETEEQYKRSEIEEKDTLNGLSVVCELLSRQMQTNDDFENVMGLMLLIQAIAEGDPLASLSLHTLSEESEAMVGGGTSDNTSVYAVFISEDVLPPSRTLDGVQEYPSELLSATGEPLERRVQIETDSFVSEAVSELVSVFDAEAPCAVTRSDVFRAGIAIASSQGILDKDSKPITMDEETTIVDTRVTDRMSDNFYENVERLYYEDGVLSSLGVCAVLELFEAVLPTDYREQVQFGLVDDYENAFSKLEKIQSPLIQISKM